jgi:hypothetical protein
MVCALRNDRDDEGLGVFGEDQAFCDIFNGDEYVPFFVASTFTQFDEPLDPNKGGYVLLSLSENKGANSRF